MATIMDIHAREVFDSRADITLEVEIALDNGKRGRSIIPTGCSKGKHEAVEIRDNDPRRFNGQGVLRAIDIVHTVIKPRLCGMSPYAQEEIDRMLIELDGTANKSRLGANTILGVSLAVANAAAMQSNLSLCDYISHGQKKFMPQPIFSMLSGGMHGDGNCDFQDYQVIALKAPHLEAALQIGKNIHIALKSLLMSRGISTGVSGTGGFLPPLSSNEQGLLLLLEAIRKAGYEPGLDVGLSMDIAAEMFFKDGLYHLATEGRTLTTVAFIDYLASICKRYPIILMEDPLGEDDFKGWTALTQLLGGKIELVGDDLFTTNLARFEQGIDMKMANSILVKPNQIGTLSETISLVASAKEAGYGIVFSRRSGETEDTSIADLAVALNGTKVKFGSLARTEAMAKYNQLLRLQDAIANTQIV
ncbi:TPA: phosphopyruvate hydratase [Salmonella enterica subsp. enterica serovar Muenchen]|nr:phosphopyruvate hydratase [Salmonella enterica subsp. enterica serovar Muenchen]EGL1840625.1 phosphopyruvate hydratase [Salmonella enterica]EGV6907250.1 phosphopyruvate hydratase [Salmonella enterica]ELN6264887.1 phosphopyruvate hydratase [Salmonella enterica]